MNETVKLILSLSLSGSILASLLFISKPFIKHRLSKTIQYTLWIVVLLRLIMPFSFENSIMDNVFYSEEPIGISSVGMAEPMNNISGNTMSPSITGNIQENKVNDNYKNNVDHSRYFNGIINDYILYIWIFGVIIALTINLGGYLWFLKTIKQGHRPAMDEENRILNSLLNGKKQVRLVRNPFITTPMLIGILRPCILIPDAYFSDEQLKNILLHEIKHFEHFDIGVKWLTLIATSIHWFNPFMYFIKKEMNHACELACDEAVIRNLTPREKQAYGETLLYVVAEHKYPASVLQATMCEEKKSLKERLVAIMNYNKRSKLILVLSGIILVLIIVGALYLGAGIRSGDKEDTPPPLYIHSESENMKVALLSSYSWEYGGKITHADSDHPTHFDYKLDNIVSAGSREQLIISTQKLEKDKQYNFTIEDISVYKDGQVVEFASNPSFVDGNLYIEGPADKGEYIYTLLLKFKDRGTVTYGFAVRVDMLTYNLEEISKYKTPYIGESSKVIGLAGNLPVADNYFVQHYIAMETSERPYGLTVFYEAASDNPYEGEWPIVTPDSIIEVNSRPNAFVLFCMIDNLDEVTFAFKTSKSDGKLDSSTYNTRFTFQRASFEEEYGDLSVYRDDLNLLEDVLSGRKIAREILSESLISQEAIDLIENNLEIIMSSPKHSSNLMDYINEHKNEYQAIIEKGEEALQYMFYQFKQGNVEGLRGQLIMRLCKELLGERNHVTDESLSPMEWFERLNI